MIGVVADDTTGANDIGLMFSKNNCSVKIIPYHENLRTEADTDVLVLDTDSRLDPPRVSYEKVYKSTKILQKMNCSLFYNKTCSVFRGNIGQEFDAMLDALEEDFAVISLAFPKNGRKTLYGIHTVYGKRLEDSEFARDPVHPMRQSNLLDILQEQTERKVSLVDIDIVRQGVSSLRQAIEDMRHKANYVIVDAENQKDLNILAEAVKDFSILCGSSALAEELPKFLGSKQQKRSLEAVNIKDDNGVLVVSGSLTPQTKGQTAYLISKGTPALILDSRKIFDTFLREQEITRVATEAQHFVSQGKDVLVMADNSLDVLKETRTIGMDHGMDPLTISKFVSASLADITKRVVDRTGLKRLIIAGGDTSGTICRKLNIKGNYVLSEIETGLPSGLAIGPEMLIVLKSGSFGQREFLANAINHLKQITSVA